MRVLELCAAAETFSFFDGIFRALPCSEFRVLAVAGGGRERLERFARNEAIDARIIKFRRSVDPIGDVRAVLEISWILVEGRFDVIHGHTPKGMLIGMIAGLLSGVPVRAVHLHGFPIETARGFNWLLLFMSDFLALKIANEVVPVGQEVKSTAESLGYLSDPSRVFLLGHGSAGGVDCSVRFRPISRTIPGQESEVTDSALYNKPFTILFIGRLARDKGLDVLVDAWRELRVRYKDCPLRLIIAGALDSRDPVGDGVMRELMDDKAVLVTGEIARTEALYAIADVVVLPTRREGLPYVPLEAGAMGLPVVASDLGACREIVIDGDTGFVVRVGDAKAFAVAIGKYIEDRRLVLAHGENARKRICGRFGKELVASAWMSWFDRLRCQVRPKVI